MAEAALYPEAKWTILGAQTQRRMTAHDIACFHTMVGYLVSTDRYFRVSNGPGFRGTESHFGMGGEWGPDLGGGLDGEVWQWQDMAFSADANLDGWDRVISMETADNGGPHVKDIPPWTPAQVEGSARWLAWVCSREAHRKCPASWRCHQEGIPLELIPDTKQGRRGVGYHRQGCDPWRVSGGERWSDAYGKECPTPQRIAQIGQIIARAREISRGDDDMPYRDWPNADKRALVEDVVDGVLGAQIARYNGKNKVRLDTILGWIYRDAHQLKRGLVSRILNARIRRHNGKPVRLETMLGWIYRDGREDPALIVDSPDGEQRHSKPFVLAQIWELLLDRAPEPVRSRLVAASAAASAPADDVEDDQSDVPDEEDEDADSGDAA